MNVIILAAGKGSRMKDLTKNKPKCFLKINGVTLIERLINQLKKLKVKDISIVTGYRANKFFFKDVNFFFNKEYRTTNMIYSLMKAKRKLNKDTLIIYSDIFISNEMLKKMLNIKKNFAVAVDIDWKKYWKFRFNKILNDLESLKINNYGHIKEIGKDTLNLKNIDARYIGIIKTSKKINKVITSIWKTEKNKKKSNWEISGNSLNKSYMTDLINHLVNSKKINCHAIKFKGGWYEFDNKKDFFKFKNSKYRKIK